MDPQLLEFAKGRLAKGETPDAVIAHLRGQKWEESVIEEVMAAAGAAPCDHKKQAAAGKRRIWPHILLIILATAGATAAVAGFFVWRQYAAAKLIREKLKYVEVTGHVGGNLEASAPANSATKTAVGAFDLLDLRGFVDSSQMDTPRAAFAISLDPSGSLAAALAQVPPTTDARFAGVTLLSIAAAGRAFGGIEATLVERTAYLRFANMPLAQAGQQNPIAALASALIGPNILTGAWLRVPLDDPSSPASDPLVPREQQVTWALLFRPTEKVFGQSRELQFLGKSAGDPINGEATDIHRYRIDGAWLTGLLKNAMRENKADGKMMMLAQLQTALTGGAAADTSDTMTLSDGEMSVWVGKKDTLPRRIAVQISVSEGLNSPIAVKLKAELSMSYGKPVTIATPEPAIGLEQLQQQLNTLQSLGNFF
ncbi:MAG: hypothetical protein FGM15_05430 [Chthoniobacterales bacterium]|nr:hypothetical protein [Chthoniobacterales bacterium]